MIPKACVVDASVAVMLFITESDSALAEAVFAGLEADPPASLYVPDLFYIELTNTLLKHTRRGDYSRKDVVGDLAQLRGLALTAIPTQELIAEACAIGDRLGISAYDACYVALSDRMRVPLVTADQRLVDAVLVGSHSVLWLRGLTVT
jgi:predicted nucleic acid-binding protein